MEDLMGLLRLHVKRGVNLAIRDVSSSDPYAVVRMGKQKLKTRVVKKNVNPEWNEDLTLSVTDPTLPVKITVYDRDIFSADDRMGEAEFTIGTFLEAIKIRHQLGGLPEGTIIMKVQPTRENCLSEESQIVWSKGKIVQDMFLRLRHVECGEVELQLEWIDIPGSRGI
ncbi:PREDICTED: protein C2-DOMAIN ABA-RELATED 1 [Tarenaya hassleriana]|uniref:protein C2-DOMAIN ABA-RELATED 1 n=1 Tax=Tarenaya hassleriana TaxID=28532 RepID=UPI00053C7AF1|nr:PREDICTED: protein C2-DOMAIN ABA-RELATED 1 [Tarenaya hassleriana]